MPQIDKHLRWCLKDQRRLIKAKPDLDLAQKHVKKSEYNYSVLQTLETSTFHQCYTGGLIVECRVCSNPAGGERSEHAASL